MRNFACCRKTIEGRVTVRKAAKSIDNLLVRHGIARPVLVAESFDQIKRMPLIVPILAMLERKVKKKPFHLGHGHIETLING